MIWSNFLRNGTIIKIKKTLITMILLNLEEDKYLFDFFKKMKFDENQRIKFSSHIEDFLFKNNEKNLRSALIRFFKSFI